MAEARAATHVTGDGKGTGEGRRKGEGKGEGRGEGKGEGRRAPASAEAPAAFTPATPKSILNTPISQPTVWLVAHAQAVVWR